MDEAELLGAIENSAATQYLNKSHSRTFSLNVFKINAQQLIMFAQHIGDPMFGVDLMSEKNAVAGTQAHREINRLAHNFLCAAMTLVEHTRNFMREHYVGTEVYVLYGNEIRSLFAEDPLSQFVQNLRNYMVHKGLPNSQMFLEMTNNPNATKDNQEFVSGVRYPVATLTKWDKWSAAAKSYMAASGAHIDILKLAVEYNKKTVEFQAWLDEALKSHHQQDLSDLSVLQMQLAQVQSKNTAGHKPQSIERQSKLPEFGFSSTEMQRLQLLCDEILSELSTQVVGPHPGERFPSDRPLAGHLTKDDLVGPVAGWLNDADGNQVFVFHETSSGLKGFSESTYEKMEQLLDTILEAEWPSNTLSRDFLQKVFLDWCRSSDLDSKPGNFCGTLSRQAERAVKTLSAWVPIANLETQAPFEFGLGTISPISADMINARHAELLSSQTGNEEEISLMIDRIRKEMQGWAAVTMTIRAEPEFASERISAISNDTVALLNFFSPAASNPRLQCPVAPLGSEYVPMSHSLVFGEGHFSYSQQMLQQELVHWRISEADVHNLRNNGLSYVSNLVSGESISEFDAAVRGSVLLFANGIVESKWENRLVYTLASMEKLLLKHNMEYAEFNVAERMSRLISLTYGEVSQIRTQVLKAYRLRNQRNGMLFSHSEKISYFNFVSLAHEVIRHAFANATVFQSQEKFIDSIEKRSFSDDV